MIWQLGFLVYKKYSARFGLKNTFDKLLKEGSGKQLTSSPL